MPKEKFNKNIHKLNRYNDEQYTGNVYGGSNKIYQGLKKDEEEYNKISIDEFEREKPELAEQCRQFLSKF